MKRFRFFLLVCLCAIAGPVAYASNVEIASAPDLDHQPLDLRIWYPTDAATPDVVKGAHLPLIVISHGTGGSKEGHEDTARALADAGFVVVAMTHTGDNYRDASSVRRITQLTDRPRHVMRTIDFMLSHWRAHGQIDAERIGMFGFSAGGFTALVLAGAQPDLTRTVAHCRQHPQAWTCQYLRKNGVVVESMTSPPANEWQRDPRVKAAVLAAPAIGYSFGSDALRAVHIPIQLWGSEHDHIVDDSADIVRGLLPVAPEYHLAANAGHFSFMTPCNWRLHSIIWLMSWFGTEAICSDPDGFDRVRFHQDFNAEVVRVFSKALR